MMPTLTSIAVYCGSSLGGDPAYAEAATLLGTALASRKIALIYGGGNLGLMGALASSVLHHGGHVTGVLPDFFLQHDLGHELKVSELHVVKSMHERKALMAELADAFIALPGGIGTLEELAEVLTWAQLGLHAKPVGLLNTSGFFDHLLHFLDHAVSQKFLKQKNRNLILVSPDPARLLDQLTA